MSRREREKGKRGEREFAALARASGFEEAKRGQQFRGGGDSPDCVGIPGLHVEVKRTETYSHRGFCEQAIRDAAGKPWAVFHRYSHGEWTATVDAKWLLKVLQAGETALQEALQ